MKFRRATALLLAGIMATGLTACGETKKESDQGEKGKKKNWLFGHGERMKKRNLERTW